MLIEGLMMATKEEETTIFWDMITCPVTSSSDASRVGPCIKLALKNLGYSGCITVTALGILTSIDTDILRAIYSSGVSLIHINTHHFGFAMELMSWRLKHRRRPSNFMLMSCNETLLEYNVSINKSEHNLIQKLPFGPPPQQVLDHLHSSNPPGLLKS
ncbi:PREDICTED: uncharacterized protein LOC104783789 [Camelina sativa]|uniref:Uncharacterized protein LOC104783789 n=1 Tax=Camelina sativa TaxID=90675 RepID=A0ABM0YX34_CAMSA|nr:PREDICTED: uncharacterized protein LOC104783789 [Camelina sativa]